MTPKTGRQPKAGCSWAIVSTNFQQKHENYKNLKFVKQTVLPWVGGWKAILRIAFCRRVSFSISHLMFMLWMQPAGRLGIASAVAFNFWLNQILIKFLKAKFLIDKTERTVKRKEIAYFFWSKIWTRDCFVKIHHKCYPFDLCYSKCRFSTDRIKQGDLVFNVY